MSLSTMLIKDKQNEKNDELLANIETTSETITTTTETTTIFENGIRSHND